MTKREMEKLVYQRYPKDKKEKKCEREKQAMDEKRNLFKKRLIEQEKEKREIK